MCLPPDNALVGTSMGSRVVNASLYVGDLPEQVDEAALERLFTPYGRINSIRVCRDAATRQALGYGYVNYQHKEDAAAALAALNYHVVSEGRAIRVMFSQRDPSIRRSGVGNLFVKNLDPSVSNKQLGEAFAAYGPVLSCKVATDSAGASKGYGFVQFESEADAEAATAGLDGAEVWGRELSVGPFVRRGDRSAASSKLCNVYVKQLGDSVTEATLERVFSQVGPVSSAVVMRDAEGHTRGFGFVNFENPEDAAHAVDTLDGYMHEGEAWSVSKAQKKGDKEQEKQLKLAQQQACNLYVKGIGTETDEEALRQLFQECGKVVSTTILRDPQTRASKGIGFVQFPTPGEAAQAIVAMDGRQVGNLTLRVAPAQRKADKQQQPQQQQQQQLGYEPPGTPGRSFSYPGAGVPYRPDMPFYPPGPAGVAPTIYYGAPAASHMYAAPYAVAPMLPDYSRGMAGMQPTYVPMMPAAMSSMGSMGSMSGMSPTGLPMMGGGYQISNLQLSMQQLGLQQQQQPRQRPQGQSSQPSRPGATLGRGRESRQGGEAGASGPDRLGSSGSAYGTSGLHIGDRSIGDSLYSLVEAIEPADAGQVTSLLLEMDRSRLLQLMSSPTALRTQIAEAMEVVNSGRTTSHIRQHDLSSFSM